MVLGILTSRHMARKIPNGSVNHTRCWNGKCADGAGHGESFDQFAVDAAGPTHVPDMFDPEVMDDEVGRPVVVTLDGDFPTKREYCAGQSHGGRYVNIRCGCDLDGNKVHCML